MAYTTAFRDTSNNTARYTRNQWMSSVATEVDQKNTTVYWQSQNKKAITRAWTNSGIEPTNP